MMNIVVLISAMIVAGIIVGWLAGLIWKGERPIGTLGDYAAAIITAIVVGLLDWYVIPAMGFSENLRNIAIIFEPALSALLVLWIIRAAKK
jgi:uncharacterized membrane protein YeaQ/YmgE (transglycosylase-associated protein family)